METKPVNIITIVVVLVVVGITAWQLGNKSASSKSIENYKEVQKTRLEGTGMFMPEGTEVKQLSGTIKSINDKTITIALSYPKDLFSDPSLDERNITVDEKTTIALLVEKDRAVFQKELEEYQNQIRSGKSDIPPPQIFDKKSGDFSLIKVGQTVNVTTTENVKNSKSFMATTIEILPPQSASHTNL